MHSNTTLKVHMKKSSLLSCFTEMMNAKVEGLLA